MAREILGLSGARAVLEGARTIAVLGAHPEPARPAFYVPAYLASAGYRVLPVNPRFVGQRLFGEVVRATLSELGEPVDVVDVFRRAVDLQAHQEDLLGMAPLPAVVWLQSGIRDAAFAAVMQSAGVDVVQDRCTYADHRALGLGRRS